MEPTALFDKSFIQSLSVDEAVWFDNFFSPNICPIYFAETLAGLEKQVKAGSTPEQAVGNLAEKTPQVSGGPNVHHKTLFLNDLMGHRVRMAMRPVLAHGRPVESDGRKGIDFGVSPEARALARWHAGEYLELEREFAKDWRRNLELMSFENSKDYAEKLGIDLSKCKNMKDAFKVAQEIVVRNDKPFDLFSFIIEAVGVPAKYQRTLFNRFKISGCPPLVKFAPYAAHVVKVEVFFHICVSRGFISSERPSNRIDISYLHYLPFCHVFVSGDKLHRTAAEFFLRGSQRFVWAPDLKEDLKKLDSHYRKLPEAVKDLGICSFAQKPPTEGEFLISDLWDVCNKTWREKPNSVFQPVEDKEMSEYIRRLSDAETSKVDPESIGWEDNMIVRRSIRKKRGSWYQIPKDYEES